MNAAARSLQFSLASLLLFTTMTVTALAAFGAWGIAVAAIVGGVVVWVRSGTRIWPRVLIVAATLAASAVIVIRFTAGDDGTRHRSSCLNQLMEIGLALNKYREQHRSYPPPYLCDA